MKEAVRKMPKPKPIMPSIPPYQIVPINQQLNFLIYIIMALYVPLFMSCSNMTKKLNPFILEFCITILRVILLKLNDC